MFGFELSQHPFVARPPGRRWRPALRAEDAGAARPALKAALLAEEIARPDAAGAAQHLGT
jgi:hypothetical protein